MPGKINRILKLGGAAALDTVAGTSVSYLVDSFYRDDPTGLTYLQLVSRVVSKAFLTAWLGDEVRDFLYPFDYNDPTNGFFFAAAMLWQPQFYADAKLLVARSLEKVLMLPIFDLFPTLASAQKNPNDPDLSKPVDAKIKEAANSSLNLLKNFNQS